MTNLEKIANVFDELGWNVDFAKDGSFILVHYEIVADAIYHFDASFENMEEYDLNDIDWEEELEIRFDFEEELVDIERDFCFHYIKEIFDDICSENLQNIVDNWKKEKEQIEMEFGELCEGFSSLIKKYTKED